MSSVEEIRAAHRLLNVASAAVQLLLGIVAVVAVVLQQWSIAAVWQPS